VKVAGGLVVAILAVGLWFLWSTRSAPMEAIANDAPAHMSASASQGDAREAASTKVVRSDPSDSEVLVARSQPSSPPTTSAPVATTPSHTPALVGVQPLTQADEQRLEAFVDNVAQDSNAVRDLEELADHEPADTSAEALARVIAEAIHRHGVRLNALRAAPPYCTQTICRMIATGGFDTSAPNADWQDLMGAVMNDPMLEGQFVDTRTTVQGDQKGLMYVTYFVRKP
jgi:hypothetical protein